MARFFYNAQSNSVIVTDVSERLSVLSGAVGRITVQEYNNDFISFNNGNAFIGIFWWRDAQDEEGNQLGATSSATVTALQAIFDGPDTRPLYVTNSAPPAPGSMLFIGEDGTAQAAPSSIVEDNIVFPSGTQFQQDALDIGNIARLCSVGSFINIKNRATGERFEIVDYQSDRASASTPASRLRYQVTESAYTDIFTVTTADQVPINERSFNWNANFTGRVWGLRFNFASAVTNLRIRLIDTTDEDNEQTVWTYPDNMAFLTGTGGSDHAAGVTEIDLGDSPLYAPITRSQRFELLADSGTITIDETSGNPEFGILRQVAERITLADANDDLALFEAGTNRALEVRPAVLPVSDGPTPRPTYLGSTETPAELVVNAGNTNVITFLDMSEEFFDWTPTDDLRGFDVRFRRPNSAITNLRGRIENPDGEAIAYFPSAEAWFSGEGGTTLTASVGDFTVATEHPFVVAANTTYRVRVRADGGQLRWQGPAGSDGQRNLYFATLAHTLETIELARLSDIPADMGGDVEITPRTIADNISAQPDQLVALNATRTALSETPLRIAQDNADAPIVQIGNVSDIAVWSDNTDGSTTANGLTTATFTIRAPATRMLSEIGLTADDGITGLKVRVSTTTANGEFSRVNQVPDGFGANLIFESSFFFEGELYAIGGTGSGGVNRLYRIDIDTGQTTLIDGPNLFDSQIGSATAATEHNGVVYTVNRTVSRFFSLNVETGVATQIGNDLPFTGAAFIPAGMASLNGNLYLIEQTNGLYTVDPATGAATRVGNANNWGLSGATVSLRSLTASEDTLYAGGFNGDLYTLDAQTGVATLVRTSNISAINSLAYRNGIIYSMYRGDTGLTTRFAVAALDDIGFAPTRGVFEDQDVDEGLTVAPVDGRVFVQLDRTTEVTRNTDYNVTIEWRSGTLRHNNAVSDPVFAFAVRYADGQRDTLAKTSQIEDFALKANTATAVPNSKITPNYNETTGDTTLTVDNWPGYRNGVLRTSGSMLILHADIAEDGDRLCVHKVGSNTLTISSDDGNVTVNGEAMYEITAEGKYDLIVRGQDWEVMVPQPTSAPVRYNRYLGTIGSSNADFTSFPEALENESVRATNAPGTVNGRFLSPQVEYRANQDTAANMPDNWDALPVFVSPDSGGPISITDLSTFGTNDPVIELPEGYSRFTLVIEEFSISSFFRTTFRLGGSSNPNTGNVYRNVANDGTNSISTGFVLGTNQANVRSNITVEIVGARNADTVTTIKTIQGGGTSSSAAAESFTSTYGVIGDVSHFHIITSGRTQTGTAYLYGDPDEAQPAQPGGAISTFSVTDPRNAIDFDLPSGYSNFRLVFSGVSISTAGWDLTFIVGNDSNFITSGYNYRQSILPASTSTSSTIPNRYFSNRAAIDVTGTLTGPNFTTRASGEIRIFGARETDTATDIHFSTIGGSGGGRNGINGWGETATNSGIVTRCRLAVAATTVNFTRGNFYLYGDPA